MHRLTLCAPLFSMQQLFNLRKAVQAKQAKLDALTNEIEELHTKIVLDMHDTTSCSAVGDADLLESHKQLALSAHAFDEASRLAEEIKHLPAKRKEMLLAVQTAKALLTDKHMQVALVEGELEAQTVELEKAVRESEMKKMADLAALVASLNQLNFTQPEGLDQVVRSALEMVLVEQTALERRLNKMKEGLLVV